MPKGIWSPFTIMFYYQYCMPDGIPFSILPFLPSLKFKLCQYYTKNKFIYIC